MKYPEPSESSYLFVFFVCLVAWLLVCLFVCFACLDFPKLLECLVDLKGMNNLRHDWNLLMLSHSDCGIKLNGLGLDFHC